ncbi:Oidioi.mRNA.OKI2018_I69.PAR.g10634.t1.cds [Oikopleura dioica]|uniref:Oidioi.mRNA.OKI2018_I69.PAR.g10634.t1.cds n=1 Tax=Oikopleura dioica TaxID=34765 RepID=A0ABN7RVU5_OIKDI|nr:Oidioi.mRNA.OKI2018_I69.PAR.g10634.t1.cds [Oikopleura dioica]
MPLYIAEVSEDEECSMNLKNLRPYKDNSEENFKLLQKIKKLQMEKENLRLEVEKEKSKNRSLREENMAQQGEITELMENLSDSQRKTRKLERKIMSMSVPFEELEYSVRVPRKSSITYLPVYKYY